MLYKTFIALSYLIRLMYAKSYLVSVYIPYSSRTFYVHCMHYAFYFSRRCVASVVAWFNGAIHNKFQFFMHIWLYVECNLKYTILVKELRIMSWIKVIPLYGIIILTFIEIYVNREFVTLKKIFNKGNQPHIIFILADDLGKKIIFWIDNLILSYYYINLVIECCKHMYATFWN